MNARCSPPRILAHHAKNQLSNLIWGRPSPNRPSHPRNQFPIQPKTCSVPADHRIGRDHDERLFPLWPESTYCNPEGLIEKPEVWPRMAALQTTSCWRRTRFSKSRARRVRKRRPSAPNQSKNRLTWRGVITNCLARASRMLLILRTASILARHRPAVVKKGFSSLFCLSEFLGLSLRHTSRQPPVARPMFLVEFLIRSAACSKGLGVAPFPEEPPPNRT